MTRLISELPNVGGVSTFEAAAMMCVSGTYCLQYYLRAAQLLQVALELHSGQLGVFAPCGVVHRDL